MVPSERTPAELRRLVTELTEAAQPKTPESLWSRGAIYDIAQAALLPLLEAVVKLEWVKSSALGRRQAGLFCPVCQARKGREDHGEYCQLGQALRAVDAALGALE